MPFAFRTCGIDIITIISTTIRRRKRRRIRRKRKKNKMRKCFYCCQSSSGWFWWIWYIAKRLPPIRSVLPSNRLGTWVAIVYIHFRSMLYYHRLLKESMYTIHYTTAIKSQFFSELMRHAACQSSTPMICSIPTLWLVYLIISGHNSVNSKQNSLRSLKLFRR